MSRAMHISWYFLSFHIFVLLKLGRYQSSVVQLFLGEVPIVLMNLISQPHFYEFPWSSQGCLDAAQILSRLI